MSFHSEADYFLCLCSQERQPQLAAICAQRSHPIEFVERIEDVLVKALLHPPQGLILEIATAIRVGAERMSKFLNLGVSWPVMRCALTADGDAKVMCFEPPRGELLLSALDAIAARDEAWRHPRFRRRHLRLHIKGRVRLRTSSDDRWLHGSLSGISCGGCFVVMTSDAPAVGEEIELELVDFEPVPQRLRAVVSWRRNWADSMEMPGIGVEFRPASVTDEFRSYITQSPQLSDLIAEE